MDPTVPVEILGVNAIGSEAGNLAVVQGKDRPWLQDTSAEGAASRWGVMITDLVVLDADNVRYQTYSLSTHDLAVPANYEELRSILLAAAAASAP
jgi:hypothetical protein